MSLQPIDLVVHDWMNLALEERKQAIADIKALAEQHSGRRARAINIVASFFMFLTAGETDQPSDDEVMAGVNALLKNEDH